MAKQVEQSSQETELKEVEIGWNKLHLWAIIEMIKLWEMENGLIDGNISDVTGILRGSSHAQRKQHTRTDHRTITE